MTSPWWKRRVALALVLSVFQYSEISAAATVVIKDAADKSTSNLNDDQSLQRDVKSSTDCDSLTVSVTISAGKLA